MQSHPSHSRLAELLGRYPESAGALFQTFNDVTLAQRWTDIQILELPKCGRGAIKGLRPSLSNKPLDLVALCRRQTEGEPSSICVAVPCGLAESLSTSWIRDAFDALGNQLPDAPETIFVAICSEDSSIVYYRISKGIIKPRI